MPHDHRSEKQMASGRCRSRYGVVFQNAVGLRHFTGWLRQQPAHRLSQRVNGLLGTTLMPRNHYRGGNEIQPLQFGIRFFGAMRCL
jgi:hypothetical protein